MFLAVDVGNTQSTIGLYDKSGKLKHGWRMATNTDDTADELRERLFGYFLMDKLDLGCVDDAGVACVVPALIPTWTRCFTKLLGKEPLVVNPKSPSPLSIGLPNPTSIGADRIANAVAALNTYGAPVIVVDFGTATNIDVVDETGTYRGGALSPGLKVSARALFGYASMLASVPVRAPKHALGDTTETAIQSGLVIGAAVQAEGLVKRIKDELGIADAPVIGTGGLASTVAQATDLFTTIDDDLTLRGIRELWLWARKEEH